jgi:hypothetical protein
MRIFGFFRRKPESVAEEQALANLDEVTREVAWDEEDKTPVATDDRSPRDVTHEDDAR